MYNKLKQKLADQGIKCDFVQGEIITEADLDVMADPNGGQTLLIVDDNSISAASSKEMAHVFTIARHKNCSIVLLLHFIFGPWPSSRIISANTAYFFLLKSPRMAKQVATLGSQLGKQRVLVAAYDREAKKRYGYVLVDLCTATPEYQRVRTDIFAEITEAPIKTDPIVTMPMEQIQKIMEPVVAAPKPLRKWITWEEHVQKGRNIKKERAPKRKVAKIEDKDESSDDSDSSEDLYEKFGMRRDKGKVLLEKLMALKH